MPVGTRTHTTVWPSPSLSHLQHNAGVLEHNFPQPGSDERLCKYEAAAGHDVKGQGGVAVRLHHSDTQQNQINLWGSMTSHITLAKSQQAFTLMF